jgi:hypothetical protein
MSSHPGTTIDEQASAEGDNRSQDNLDHVADVTEGALHGRAGTASAGLGGAGVGAAIGTVIGGVPGAVVGSIIGALAGGFAGKAPSGNSQRT